MELSGLHLLLTYSCTHECDHCFVWGSPRQTGTMTRATVDRILDQATELDGVEWIYFEGGEPFMHYAVLRRGVELAAASGFSVGVVTNAYWATDVNDAVETLRPFAGLVRDLSISSDLYHDDETPSERARFARLAARRLEIPVRYIRIAQPEASDANAPGEYRVSLRGRAAARLTAGLEQRPWHRFDACTGETLEDPRRVHVDPFGNVHLCQGLLLGNLFHSPLAQLCAAYRPETHPLVGPLMAGGPAELVRRFGLSCSGRYADACHLCFETRRKLRGRFPELLGPDQMYGVPES